MNQGKLVFSQLMAFLPLSTFRRCVAKHRGDHKVQDFTCMDQFLTMAFAQLTYRESLRDIEACLTANQPKLFLLHLQNKPPCSAVQPSLALATSLVLALLALLRKEIYAPLVLALWGWAAFRKHRPQAIGLLLAMLVYAGLRLHVLGFSTEGRAGNSLLADTLRDFTARTTLIAMRYQSSHHAAHSCAEHVEIVRALEQGESARAEQLMQDHIGHVQSALQLHASSDDALAQLRQALQPVAKAKPGSSSAQDLHTSLARQSPQDVSTYLGKLL